MHLTDNLGNPRKWQIPGDIPTLTTIPAAGHLLIWADGDVEDNGSVQSGLHAGFELDAQNDEIGLFDSNGTTLIDSVSFRNHIADISYGRLPDGSETWSFFGVPSPGQPNLSVYSGLVEDVELSDERGFYGSSFSVTIACDTDGAEIYYTLDGTDPYNRTTGVATGTLYSGAIAVSKTTCLQAAAIKIGWKPSTIATHTYIFVADVAKQSPGGEAPGPGWPAGSVNGQVANYGMDPDVVNNAQYKDLIDDALLSIPSISLVTDLANLFDPTIGIYVNANKEGRPWERPTSVELLNPDGSKGFQLNAGLRIRGGYSRKDGNPKHAFRLLFRAEYGQGKLRYPMFEDEGVDAFDNMDLRTSQNYCWAHGGGSGQYNTMVREVFSRDLHGAMGHPYTRSRYYHLYINGVYWGLFQTQERAEASHAEANMGGDEEDYDVVKADRAAGRAMWATDGDKAAFNRLYDEAMACLDDSERYYRIQGLNMDGTANPDYEKLLDVDNLIDYMIIEYYTGDRDGPGSRFGNKPNNTTCIYNRLNPDGWKWFHHDNEHTLGVGSSEVDMVTPFTTAGAQEKYFNPHWLHEQLANSNIDYRLHFADHVHKHFFNNGLLTLENARNAIQKRADQIDMAIIAESARWGDASVSSPRTKNGDWLPEIDRLLYNTNNKLLTNRISVVLGQLKGVGWYPNVNPPTLDRFGGPVPKGYALEMSAPAGKIYYTTDGADPRMPSVQACSSGAVTLVREDAEKRALVPTEAISNNWRGGGAFDDSAWVHITGSPGGIGYDEQADYKSQISYDVEDLMNGDLYAGANTSAYVRIPFAVDACDIAEMYSLTLRVRYDDGFVAFINGARVESERFSETDDPVWNSKASSNHEAGGLEPFDITEHIDKLRAGDNILALQGMNVSLTSSDFIISGGLVAARSSQSNPGGPGAVSPDAREYSGPIALDYSTVVKARVLNNAWSPLAEATFAVGAVVDNLRITSKTSGARL